MNLGSNKKLHFALRLLFKSIIHVFQFLRNKATDDEGKRAINLLQFWLDVQAFKTFCNSISDEVNSNTEILKDQVSSNQYQLKSISWIIIVEAIKFFVQIKPIECI